MNPVLVAYQRLVSPMGQAGSFYKLSPERRGDPLGVKNRYGRPESAGHVRGGVRGLGFRIDGRLITALRQYTSRGQSDYPAADHRTIAKAGLHPLLDGQLRRPPGEGDPGAAMPVMVDDPLLADSFAADDESRRPEWP